MPLTPEEIRQKSFKAVYKRGYDRDEVDAFLAQVAADYSAAIQKIAVAAEGGIDSSEDIAAEVSEVLRVARESALRINQKARESADGVLADAHQRANELTERAERQHAEARARVEAEARRMIELAEQRALELRESAERERNETLDQVQKRYAALTSLEDQLRDRIGSLEGLVGEMRAQVGPAESKELPSDGAGEPLALAPSGTSERQGDTGSSGSTTRSQDGEGVSPEEPAEDRSPQRNEAPGSEGEPGLWEVQERLRTAVNKESE